MGKRIIILPTYHLPRYCDLVATVAHIDLPSDRTQISPSHTPFFAKHRSVLTLSRECCLLNLPQRATRSSPVRFSSEPSPFPKDVSSTLSPVALEQIRFDVLASLPVPADYPSEPLRPIFMPTRMDLEGFLDHSTGVSID